VVVNRHEIVRALLGLGVESGVAADLPDLPSGVIGLMVYGSQARGDAVDDSDLDLLALSVVPRPSIQVALVSISFYTSQMLETGIGTLFGAHLNRDGKILIDKDNQLRTAIDSMGEVDTDRLFERARRMSQLFTSLDRDLPKYLPGLVREARYLLRSCYYARAISDGEPCFSIRELAKRHKDPVLVRLLASRHQQEPSVRELTECLARLRGVLGDFPRSEHGSLEATIVNEWESPGDLLSMAFLALGVTGQGSDYAEVGKILL
jgi:predicted nucleotidyltransferase